MNTRSEKFSVIIFLAFVLALAMPCLAQNVPFEATSPNIQYVGSVQFNGVPDQYGYSKLGPWPDIDRGQYLYSGCYDSGAAEELHLGPGATQCFMTVSVKDPKHAVRLATVYAYDRDASPEPPVTHPVWKSPDLALLPVKVPCPTFKDPDVLSGKKRPTCWDPGWNTHNHYVQHGPGNILAVNEERWRRGTDTQASYHGVKFYDVSDPVHPKFLADWEAPVSDPVNGHYVDAGGAHHFNFRNMEEKSFESDPNNRYLFLGTEYKGFIGKILVILDVRDPKHPVEAGQWHIPGQKTPEEDAQRDWVQQASFSNPIRVDEKTGKLTKHVGMHYATVNGDTAYLFYHQGGLVILNVHDPKHPQLLSRLDYLVPGFDDPTMPASMKQFPLDKIAYGNSHSGKLVPGHPNLMWMTDEYFTCPYGHLRMVDVSDPTKPKIISHFLYPENTACDPQKPLMTAYPLRFPRRGPSSHLGNMRDGFLFLAWYGMGMRVIDLHDPLHPTEAGYYHYEIDPSKPAFAGADTYDVILGPNGLLYVSDGSSGLRIVKFSGPDY